MENHNKKILYLSAMDKKLHRLFFFLFVVCLMNKNFGELQKEKKTFLQKESYFKFSMKT